MTIRIIPRLDIKGPNLVKGIHLEGLRVLGKPEMFAKYYYLEGADELIYMDVVASLYQRNSILPLISRTAREIFIPLTVGGGINSLEDIRNLLKAGADKVSINTAAILNEKLIAEASQRFGSQCIVRAVDAKKQNDNWIVFSHGGTKKTDIDAIEWMEKLQKLGAGEILLTSMDKDGAKSGFDLELLKITTKKLTIPVIASGGVGSLQDFKDGVIVGGASALLAASVFHYNEYSISDVKEYLKNENIEVRL